MFVVFLQRDNFRVSISESSKLLLFFTLVDDPLTELKSLFFSIGIVVLLDHLFQYIGWFGILCWDGHGR